jgi:flagellar hook assembly protein FlgD
VLTIRNRTGKSSPVIIHFSVRIQALAMPVYIAVYTMRGSLVRQLFAGKAPPGDNEVAWDGLGPRGSAAANGSYVVDIAIDGRHQHCAVVLAR